MIITICINDSIQMNSLVNGFGQQQIPGHYFSSIGGEIKYEGRKMEFSVIHCTRYVYGGRYWNTLSIIILL